MVKYEYRVVLLKIDMVWTGKPETDYLEVLNEYGKEGWRFVDFVPGGLRPKGVKGQEILFERQIETT